MHVVGHQLECAGSCDGANSLGGREWLGQVLVLPLKSHGVCTANESCRCSGTWANEMAPVSRGRPGIKPPSLGHVRMQAAKEVAPYTCDYRRPVRVASRNSSAVPLLFVLWWLWQLVAVAPQLKATYRIEKKVKKVMKRKTMAWCSRGFNSVVVGLKLREAWRLKLVKKGNSHGVN